MKPFDQEHIVKYPQARLYLMAKDDAMAEGYDGLMFQNTRQESMVWDRDAGCYRKSADGDGTIITQGKLKDIAAQSGLVGSRSEFKRKVQEGAVLWAKGLDEMSPLADPEFVVDMEHEGFYEMQLGNWVLEFVVAGKEVPCV